MHRYYEGIHKHILNQNVIDLMISYKPLEWQGHVRVFNLDEKSGETLSLSSTDFSVWLNDSTRGWNYVKQEREFECLKNTGDFHKNIIGMAQGVVTGVKSNQKQRRKSIRGLKNANEFKTTWPTQDMSHRTNNSRHMLPLLMCAS